MDGRILCVLMALLLVLTLAACSHSGQKPSGEATTASAVGTETPSGTAASISSDTEVLPTENEFPTESQSAETEPPTEAQTSESAETEPPVETTVPITETETPEPSHEENPSTFANVDALEEYLLGAWNFYPTNEDEKNTPEIGGIPGFTIQIAPGGVFMLIRHMDFAQYQGTWELDRLFAEEHEVPDMIRFTLDEPDETLKDAGTFLIQGWSHCTGSDRLSLVQVNVGESVISAWFDLYDAMLVKGGDFPTDESEDPSTDAHFCAMVWQVADDGETLWLTQVDPLDFSVGLGSRTAVRYVLAGDCEIRCPISAFVRGGTVAEIQTNSAGEISMINWAEPVLEG